MTDTLALPLWAIIGAIVVLLAVAIVGFVRAGTGWSFGFFGQVLASLLVVAVAWVYLDRLDAQSRVEQRRAIDARLAALTAQTLAPGSSLACVDANAGDLVLEACEKAIFESPEQAAAAVAYVGARLDVLRDIASLPDADQAAYDHIRRPLVNNLSADRFGLVAQVLTARDRCSAESCEAFEWMPGRDQLVANMKTRAYESRISRFSSNWRDKPAGAALATHTSPSAPSGTPVNINFPTAASIPPVSIMSNEPGMPGQNGVDMTPRPEPKQAAPSQRRPPAKKEAARPEPAPRPSSQGSPFPQPIGAAQPAAPASAPQQSSSAPVSITPQ